MVEDWLTVVLASFFLFIIVLIYIFKQTATPDPYTNSKYVIKLKFIMAVSLIIPVVLIFLVFALAFEIGGYLGLVVPALVMIIVLEYVRSYGTSERPYSVTAEQSPKLHSLVVEVSERMGIGKAPEICLCRGCRAYTFGWLKPRVALGIPLFDFLTVSEFRSIVAHELGHVKNKDYAIGSFFAVINTSFESAFRFCKQALLASRSIALIVLMGIAGGSVWMLKGFLKVMSLLFQRQREFMADVQTTAFEVEDKPTNFKRGLGKVALLNSAEAAFMKQTLKQRVQAVQNGKLPMSKLFQKPHLNQFYQWMQYVGFSTSDFLIERVAQVKTSNIGRWRSWGSTHPLVGDRIHNLEILMVNHPSQDKYSPAEHDDAKAKVLIQENYDDAVKAIYVSEDIAKAHL